MEIYNARIKDVTVGPDERNCSVSFDGQGFCCNWEAILTNPAEDERLRKLMQYADTYDVNKMNGKIVRIVIIDTFLRAFGDPIQDKFVPILGAEFVELAEEQLEEVIRVQ